MSTCSHAQVKFYSNSISTQNCYIGRSVKKNQQKVHMQVCGLLEKHSGIKESKAS